MNHLKYRNFGLLPGFGVIREQGVVLPRLLAGDTPDPRSTALRSATLPLAAIFVVLHKEGIIIGC